MKKAIGLGDPMVFSASDKKNGGILIIKEDFVSDKTSVSDTGFICDNDITNHVVLSISHYDFSVISFRQEFTKSYMMASQQMAECRKGCYARQSQQTGHRKGDGIDAYGKSRFPQKKQQGRTHESRQHKVKQPPEGFCQCHQHHDHQTGDDHGR